MKFKTRELIDDALDCAVALAHGWVTFPTDSGGGDRFWYINPDQGPLSSVAYREDFTPSTDWGQGGPIMERERIGLEPPEGSVVYWTAVLPDTTRVMGMTPLIAAMRCYVLSKLGDEIEIPEELLK